MGLASSFLSPLRQADPHTFMLRNERTHQVVAAAIETAFDSSTRRKGLLGRDGLAADEALILAPCSAIHTFFMKFAIDVAYVDRHGIVVKARHHIAPWRMSAARGALAAIELREGTLERTHTRRGDRLRLEPSVNL
jgi:uncharacterized membrane protein (UPF0127 family)